MISIDSELRCAGGDFEGYVLASGFHVEAEEFLERCRFDNVEALLAAESGGLPVLGGADGVGHETLDAPGAAHVDHAQGGDGGTRPLSH